MINNVTFFHDETTRMKKATPEEIQKLTAWAEELAWNNAWSVGHCIDIIQQSFRLSTRVREIVFDAACLREMVRVHDENYCKKQVE